MTSLLSGITLRPVSKNPEKLANNEGKHEAVKVNNRKQRENKQLSKNLNKSVREEKKLPNESDERHLNIKRVTKQLFVENKEQSGDKHNLGEQTNEYSEELFPI